MTFMQHTIAGALSLWEAAANSRFLEEMGRDCLDKRRFFDYIVQDSLYLRDYVKAFAMGIWKSRSLKEIQVFCSALDFVKDSENATRLWYLADNNMTDSQMEDVPKKSACAAYTKFLLDTARREDNPEILMAVMPCMLGYHYVFRSLVKRYPAVLHTYYAPLVKDYTCAAYERACGRWTDYCDQVCGRLDEKRQEKLEKIFKMASSHELYFWEMAGGKE